MELVPEELKTRSNELARAFTNSSLQSAPNPQEKKEAFHILFLFRQRLQRPAPSAESAASCEALLLWFVFTSVFEPPSSGRGCRLQRGPEAGASFALGPGGPLAAQCPLSLTTIEKDSKAKGLH